MSKCGKRCSPVHCLNWCNTSVPPKPHRFSSGNCSIDYGEAPRPTSVPSQDLYLGLMRHDDAPFNSRRYWQVSGKQRFGRSCFWTLLLQKYSCIILHSCVRHWQSSKHSPKKTQRSSLALFKMRQRSDERVVTVHTQATSHPDHKLPFQQSLHRKKWGIFPLSHALCSFWSFVFLGRHC